MKGSCKYALLLLLASLPALAQQQSRVYRDGSGWVEEITGSLPAARNVQVSTEVGAVRVEGRNQSTINYVIRKRAYTSSEQSARKQFEAFRITAERRGDTATLEGEWSEGKSHHFSADFSLDVPRNVDMVKLETQGGSVSANNLAGRVDASSGGGNMNIDNIGGNVTGETGGGSIEVGVCGGDLNLQTGGGSIHVRSAKGRIQAETGGGSVEVVDGLQGAVLETGGGSIEVKRCQGRVKASTGGGSIELGQIGGPAELETGGGSIRLAGATGPVHAETGGGSIELMKLLQGARAETGGGGITAEFVSGRGTLNDSKLETPSGDITVYLDPKLAVTVRAAVDLANGHEIRSDFPELKVNSEGGEYGPKRVTAEGSLNGGGPVLKIHTSSGDISLLRTSH